MACQSDDEWGTCQRRLMDTQAVGLAVSDRLKAANRPLRKSRARPALSSKARIEMIHDRCFVSRKSIRPQTYPTA
jgi:hypothetical protein